MTRRGVADELRAGLFVLVGLAVLVGAILLLGEKSSLFSRNATLYVSFRDISGLVVGAPVRLSGLDVGTVTDIRFSPDLREKKARVTLVVQSQYMPRVRENSQAFIDSNGLLGDKIVNISMGDLGASPLRSGATLPAGETLTFETLGNTLHEAIASIQGVSEAVQSMLGELDENRVQEDVVSITRSLASILRMVEQGEGLAHRLIYDQRYASHFSAILVDLRSLTSNLQTAVARMDGILKEVAAGDGTLHEVIYGSGGKHAIAQLNSAAEEIAIVIREVREGEGLMHTLLYDQGQPDFLAELNEAARSIRRITDEVAKGRGTVGGLLKDPTVYEDLKTVLGNVKRNVLFKALVRFTAEQEGLRKVENAPVVHAQVPPAANEIVSGGE